MDDQPHTNGFNCNSPKSETKLKRDSTAKEDGIHFESFQCSQNNTFVLSITKENLTDNAFNIQLNTNSLINTDQRLKPKRVLTNIII